MRRARGLFAAYEHALHSRPLTTKARPPPGPHKSLAPVRIHFVRLLHGRRVCRLAPQAVTSAAIGGVGDLTCQCAIEKRELEYIDWRRFWTFTGLGGVLVAPVSMLPQRLFFLLAGS